MATNKSNKKVVVYHNPRCAKSRYALNRLQEEGYEPEVIKYLETPPTVADLRKLRVASSQPLEKFIRKEEKLYKEKYAKLSLSENEWLNELARHPELLQRPLVAIGHRAAVVRTPDEYDQLMD